jgi:isopenicillin N synthase-like dioxygenase
LSSAGTSTAPDDETRLLRDARLVPRIDMSLPRTEIARQVRAAADGGGPGFFYLVNHGIGAAVLERAVAETHAFFRSGESKKMEVSSLARFGRWGVKGYNAPGVEGAYEKDALTDVRPDDEAASGALNTREAYVLRYPEMSDFFKDAQKGEDLPPPGDVAEAARLFYAPNPWPISRHREKNHFKSTVLRYCDAMRTVADAMFGVFEEAMLHATADKDLCIPHDEGMTTFNLARYGREDFDAGTFGISDHTDWEMFTLLYPCFYNPAVGVCDKDGKMMPGSGGARPTAGVPVPIETVNFTGLEAWYEDRWMAVPHISGSIILNQGEMLSRMSGGRFKAPVHRVRANTEGQERYSLVSFWGPNYEFLLPNNGGGLGKGAKSSNAGVLAGEYYLRRSALL